MEKRDKATFLKKVYRFSKNKAKILEIKCRPFHFL